MPRFRARKKLTFGPVFVNLGTGGKSRFKSWGFRIWRWTYNVTHRRSTFDTPGPGSVHHQHGRQGSR